MNPTFLKMAWVGRLSRRISPRQFLKLLFARHPRHAREQFRPQSQTMPAIGNQHRRLSLHSIDCAEPPYAYNFVLASLGIHVVRDQRKSAIVAAKTDAHQPLMLHPHAQTERAEIPQINAALGKRFVKLHHQRLIFGANRADRHRRAVFQFPLPHILQRIWPNRGTRQLRSLHRGIVHHHSRIQRQQLLRSRQ